MLGTMARAVDAAQMVRACAFKDYTEAGMVPNVQIANFKLQELIFPAYFAIVVKQVRNLQELTQTVDVALTLVSRGAATRVL